MFVAKVRMAAITLLNAIIRWEVCELDTLRVNTP